MTTTQDEEVYSDFPVDMTDFWPPLTPGYDWGWDWYELDDNEQPTVDTTGWTVAMQLRESANGPLLAEASTANGRIVNDNMGHFSVTLPASASENISARSLVTNVKVTDGTGKPRNTFDGKIEVKENVTR